jgi:hypothetical protein
LSQGIVVDVYLSNSLFVSESSNGDLSICLSSVFDNYQNLGLEPSMTKWVVPTSASLFQFKFVENSGWKFRGDPNYSIAARMKNKIQPLDLETSVAVDLVIGSSVSLTDYFIYLSPNEDGVLLPATKFQEGVVSVQLSQNGELTLTCETESNVVSSCSSSSNVTQRDSGVLTIAVKQNVVTASFGTCSIASGCTLSSSFTNVGAYIFLGSFDSTNSSRWTTAGMYLYTRSGTDTVVSPVTTTLTRYEAPAPFSSFTSSNRGVDLTFTGQSSDSGLANPIFSVAQFDISSVAIKPLYAPTVGNFSILLSGINNINSGLDGIQLRFTSLTAPAQTAIAKCTCVYEGADLRCGAVLDQENSLSVGQNKIEISFGGSLTFHQLVKTMTLYKTTTTVIEPRCAPSNTAEMFQVDLTLGISPASMSDVHDTGRGIIPVVKIQGVTWPVLNGGNVTDDGKYQFTIPPNYPSGVYELAISVFENQTTFLPTKFLYYDSQAGSSAMTLSPLASPVGRTGISTSFASIQLRGSSFHLLMQPELQFTDTKTQIVHKTAGSFLTDFQLMTLAPRIPPLYVNSFFLNTSRIHTVTRTLLLKTDIVKAGFLSGQTALFSGFDLEVDVLGNGVLVDIVVKICQITETVPDTFASELAQSERYQSLLSTTALDLVCTTFGGPKLMVTSQFSAGYKIFFDYTTGYQWNGESALLVEIQRTSITSIVPEQTTETPVGSIVQVETLFVKTASKVADTLSALNRESWSFHRFVPRITLKTFGVPSVVVFKIPQTATVDSNEFSRVHDVKVSLDSGQTVTPNHLFRFTLLNSRTEISILRPTTGPVTGGTTVKVYGIMFIDIPSFLCKWTVTLTLPYARQFEIFSLGKRVPYGTDSAYLEVQTPSVPRIDILMANGATSLRAALDVSTNGGYTYARRDMKRGRLKAFDYQPVPVLLNATCEGSNCLGTHILPERGNVNIRIFAKNVFFSAGLLSCRFKKISDDNALEAVGKLPVTTVFATFPLTKQRSYASVGEFYCKAPAHPRSTVALEITTNGQQYVSGVTTSEKEKTTFKYKQCPIGFVAPFYYRSCTVCDQGKYAVDGGKVCELCGLHTYTEKNASLSCSKCPTNSKTTVLGSTKRLACECMKNTYSLNISWGKCLDCPLYGNCTGGWNIPKPTKGFWRTPECSASIVCNNSFLLCRPRVACPGYQKNNCSAGYTGTICGQCEPGYFRLNQMCQNCPTTFGVQIAGWKKTDPVEVAFLSLGILLLVQGSLLLVGAGCLTQKKDKYCARFGVVLSMLQALAIIIAFSIAFANIPIHLNTLLVVQLCLTLLVISAIFFFGLLVTKLGSMFVLIHFIQLLYICGRFEVPWPPLFQLFFRLLGDFAMPLILYPSYVETLAPGCALNSASNISRSIQSPHEQFATHMMGMPATMMLVSIVFLFCLGARFIGHLGLVYLPCCKKYQQHTTEQLTFLALDDARRF